MILYKVLYKVIACHLPASGTSVGLFRIGEIGRKFRALDVYKRQRLWSSMMQKVNTA